MPPQMLGVPNHLLLQVLQQSAEGLSPEVIIGLVILGVGGLVLVVGLIWVGIRERTGGDPLNDRLAQLSDLQEVKTLEQLEMELSFKDRVLLPVFKSLATRLSRLTPESQIEATRRKLELAGRAGTTDPRTFFGTRIMLMVVLGLGGAIVFFGVAKQEPSNALLFTLLLAFMGYRLPESQLLSQIKKRQNNIVKALPDALDLLTICVEAGLGFDQAMGKVYEKWDNELSVAFGRVIQEIALGKIRREALRDMAKSMDVPDITSFTAAIIQADQLGVSIAKILRIQSDQMRVKRRQRAQEKAQQAPVKMMLPMVFLIFPAMFIVLLGPAAIQISKTPLPL
ncbi:MAG: type II secretion system F family protein [Anaerolineae bacterium]